MRFLSKALLLAPLVSAAVVPTEETITYDGFKVYRVATHHDPAVVKSKVSALNAISLNLDNDEHLDLAVAPADVAAFEAFELETEVMAEDLGKDMAEEKDFEEYTGASLQAIPDLSWFNSYHSYADHVRFFQDIQGSFTGNSEIFSAGSSYQGRDLFGIHLWGSGGKGSKPAVYFHGTVHAREWISAMVVEYLTYQLVSGYGNDATVTSILDAYDFYIIPFVNPDGFVYTQTNDRLWRKNRQVRSGARCVGTDINRNWPYKWELPGGASTNSCSETYKGQAPADTAEMAGIQAFTDSLAAGRGIKLYIDWHAYGQYILYPWGFDCSLAAPNASRQDSLARNLRNRIAQSYGSSFTYGGSCSTLYATTGSSTDYLTGAAGAELAWTIELRPQGVSGGGFVLPANQILPAAIEQWEGMKYLLPAM